MQLVSVEDCQDTGLFQSFNIHINHHMLSNLKLFGWNLVFEAQYWKMTEVSTTSSAWSQIDHMDLTFVTSTVHVVLPVGPDYADH